MAHDAFISYSNHDRTVADAAVAVLEQRGVRCWIAPRDVTPGLDWSEEIVEAIERSAVMVLVLSAHANDSQQIKREVERAVHRGIPIIPFRIEDVPLSKALEFFISSPHWLDALTPPLEEHLQYLADTVQLLIERRGGARLAGSRVRRIRFVNEARRRRQWGEVETKGATGRVRRRRARGRRCRRMGMGTVRRSADERRTPRRRARGAEIPASIRCSAELPNGGCTVAAGRIGGRRSWTRRHMADDDERQRPAAADENGDQLRRRVPPRQRHRR